MVLYHHYNSITGTFRRRVPFFEMGFVLCLTILNLSCIAGVPLYTIAALPFPGEGIKVPRITNPARKYRSNNIDAYFWETLTSSARSALVNNLSSAVHWLRIGNTSTLRSLNLNLSEISCDVQDCGPGGSDRTYTY